MGVLLFSYSSRTATPASPVPPVYRSRGAMERKENNTITLLLLLFCSSFVPLSRTIHYRYRRMKYYQQLTRFSIFATVILVLNQPTMSCSSTDSTNGIVTIDSSRRGSTDSSISTLTAESNRNSGSR